MKNEKMDNQDSESDIRLDEQILDRLVDNDLNDQEYRKVLRLVEEKPDGWRQLALAFLESQAFEKELSALHDLDNELNIGPMLVDDPFQESAKKQETKTGSTPAEVLNADKETKPAESKPAWFWYSFRKSIPAIAACFAIAFAAGLYFRELQKNDPQNSNDRAASNVTAGDRMDHSTVDPNFIELVSNDSGARAQTPVYSHQQFDPGSYAREVNSLKPRIQQVVNRSGWNADERTHVVPIKDRTGNKIIVPMKEIKLTPKNLADYQ